ncbi:MAG: LppX_LprAFG lipoprotein [Micromonosporaceae bacterium]
MRSPRTAAAAVLLVSTLWLTSCTGDQDLPDDADQVLAGAVDAMADLRTVRLRVQADTDVAELPVRRVEAQVTRTGDAAGTAQVEQFGQLVEVTFVVVGDAFHYQVLGGWQKGSRAEAAALYDPSAILDPDRGVAHLLRTLTDARVEGEDEVAGVRTWRVTGGLAREAVATLLPGAPEGVTGTLWIGVERPLLHRVRVELPDGAGPVTVDLFDHDAPADIREP